MAEYIEREAAFDALFGQFCASSDETEAALNAAIEEIRAIPAADVRPVVLCKDCIHALRYTNKIKCGYWSEQTASEIVCDDDFCSYGERRKADV